MPLTVDGAASRRVGRFGQCDERRDGNEGVAPRRTRPSVYLTTLADGVLSKKTSYCYSTQRLHGNDHCLVVFNVKCTENAKTARNRHTSPRFCRTRGRAMF